MANKSAESSKKAPRGKAFSKGKSGNPGGRPKLPEDVKHVRELARQRNFGRSLVLIRGNRHPDFASAAAYNPVDLGGGETIYAWARTPEIAAVARAAFPDRPVWVIDGPTITGRGFVITEAPEPLVSR